MQFVGRPDEKLDLRYALFGDYSRLHCPKRSRSMISAGEKLVERREHVQSCRWGRLFATRTRGNDVFALTAGLMQVNRRNCMNWRLESGKRTRVNLALTFLGDFRDRRENK